MSDVGLSEAIMPISPAQCRAARALLNWSQEKLAQSASVTRSTLVEFESNVSSMMRNNLAAVEATLSAAGIEFLSENDKGLGVRFREVTMEYSNNIRFYYSNTIMKVRYKGDNYTVTIPPEIIDDLGRVSCNSEDDRKGVVQSNLPVILNSIEKKIISGDIGGNKIFLLWKDFPNEVF